MNLEESLLPWIGKTGKMLGTVINNRFKEKNINLTREQFVVLKILSDDDGKAQHDLAFITECDKTSLSRLISNMEKSNFIKRIPAKEDKRIKYVYLTSTGKNVFTTALPIIEEAIHSFQKGISKEELQISIRTIKKIQSNLSKVHSFKL
ncbi:MarR family winged helix-turn-helix transcriptional regulator [Lutibacter citreus]|uniref:MarR family winged helix-turn-helix transcriptional regulator n=1 Tax=Lutibacter citreus TaxID=2138210 RepID=UPI000DBE8805|nr:MarR family transcriptional regulator [Lutibacter citreus]